MPTSAATRAAVIDVVGEFTPPAGSPAFKRYLEPAVTLLRTSKSLVHGSWQVWTPKLVPSGQDLQPVTLATMDVEIYVSFNLSPNAGSGRNIEDAALQAYADALRVHLFGGADSGVVPSTSSALEWTGEELRAAVVDGWVWLVMRGKISFYLTES